MVERAFSLTSPGGRYICDLPGENVAVKCFHYSLINVLPIVLNKYDLERKKQPLGTATGSEHFKSGDSIEDILTLQSAATFSKVLESLPVLLEIFFLWHGVLNFD
jgi:hypothetical protein